MDPFRRVVSIVLLIPAVGCAGDPASRPSVVAGMDLPAADPAEEPAAAPAVEPAKDAPAEVPPEPPAASAGPKPVPEFPLPAALPDGDRWFVAWKSPPEGRPHAERHRRLRGDGFLREEVTWGPSVAAVAAASHGTMQTFAHFLTGRGLEVDLLDGGGKPRGLRALEVSGPLRRGTSWTISLPGSREVRGFVEGVEAVDTPAGKVDAALRVTHRPAVQGTGPEMSLWYDGDLQVLRSEVRGADGALLEVRAALRSASPTPEEAEAAFAWMRKSYGKPGSPKDPSR